MTYLSPNKRNYSNMFSIGKSNKSHPVWCQKNPRKSPWPCGWPPSFCGELRGLTFNLTPPRLTSDTLGGSPVMIPRWIIQKQPTTKKHKWWSTKNCGFFFGGGFYINMLNMHIRCHIVNYVASWFLNQLFFIAFLLVFTVHPKRLGPIQTSGDSERTSAWIHPHHGLDPVDRYK